MDGFMKARIDVPCPQCGAIFHPALDDVRLGRLVTCPNGHQVRLVDQGGGARKLDYELNRLDRQLKRAGIKVKWRRR